VKTKENEPMESGEIKGHPRKQRKNKMRRT
jgi:hypothetical protein